MLGYTISATTPSASSSRDATRAVPVAVGVGAHQIAVRADEVGRPLVEGVVVLRLEVGAIVEQVCACMTVGRDHDVPVHDDPLGPLRHSDDARYRTGVQDLGGKTAVVTGGGGGIGRALGERFLAEGMRVVLADIDEPLLDATVGGALEPGRRGARRPDRRLAARVGRAPTRRRAGTVRRGAPRVQQRGDPVGLRRCTVATPRERLALGRRRERLRCDPRHQRVRARIARAGRPGHVVNTSSSNGTFAPLPNSAVYSTTKAAVTNITECLWGQMRAADRPVQVSLLLPSTRTPGALQTGIWRPGRNRPDRYRATGTGARRGSRRTHAVRRAVGARRAGAGVRTHRGGRRHRAGRYSRRPVLDLPPG